MRVHSNWFAATKQTISFTQNVKRFSSPETRSVFPLFRIFASALILIQPYRSHTNIWNILNAFQVRLRSVKMNLNECAAGVTRIENFYLPYRKRWVWKRNERKTKKWLAMKRNLSPQRQRWGNTSYWAFLFFITHIKRNLCMQHRYKRRQAYTRRTSRMFVFYFWPSSQSPKMT